MTKICAIIAAAGNSSRFAGDDKKTFVKLNGKPVWFYSAEVFFAHPDVSQIVVAVSPDDVISFGERFAVQIERLDIQIVAGGAQRSDTVQAALAAVDDGCGLVAIHDGARPCFTLELFESVVQAAKTSGASIPAVPVNSTVKRVGDGGLIQQTVDRDGLFLAQTPQVFQTPLIIDAYKRRGDFQPTDEASLLETLSMPVVVVAGSKFNIKITQPEDLRFAEACLAASEPLRIDSSPDERIRR